MEDSTPATRAAPRSVATADADEAAANAPVQYVPHCSGSGGHSTVTAEVGVQYCGMQVQDAVLQLEQDKAKLKERLEFVEELVGPTEAQRKTLQEQIIAARNAALRAKHRGAALPTKVAGRLDERLIWSHELSERDAGLLQGGCLPNKEGILQDVSLLGDPSFRPYDEHTGELRWNARGGMLQLSLGEVRNRFGEDVAHDVVRCAKELDRWDPSRRVGVELPWHPLEDRELQPAEVIDLLDRELSLQANMMYYDDRDSAPSGVPPASQLEGQENYASPYSNYASPYTVANAQPRRGRGRRARPGRARATDARNVLAQGGNLITRAGIHSQSGGRGDSAGSATAQGGGSAVVALPRVGTDAARRGMPEGGRCALPGHLRHRMQESLDHSLIGCHDRIRIF